MITFPDMLVKAAEEAGMKVPPDADNFAPEQFPHFHVFCNVQLCRAIRWGEHWNNAIVVAAVPEADLKKVTVADLIGRGLEYHTDPC